MKRALAVVTPHGSFTRTTHRAYTHVVVGRWPEGHECFAYHQGEYGPFSWNGSEVRARKSADKWRGRGAEVEVYTISQGTR